MLHKRAVFFDRDGTLLVPHPETISKPEHLRVYPGIPEAIAILNRAGFRVIVVTNQAAVGRGVISEMELLTVHNHLKRLLASEGAKLDAILYAPHYPAAPRPEHRGRAHERKPATGLFEEAARRYHISLKDSFVVGDSLEDMQAARSIGAKAVLVRTGKGVETERLPGNAAPDAVRNDAAEAAVWIGRQVGDLPLNGKKIVFVLAGRNFQDREYLVTRLILETLGADIHVAGATRNECVSTGGARVRPDTTIKSAGDGEWDAVIFVGGEGARGLLDCRQCQSLARMQFEKKRTLAAICVAPSILANAHLLGRRAATAWHTELPNLRKQGAIASRHPVVRDENIVTAAGPSYAEGFADEIRASILGEKNIERTVASRAEAS